MNTRLQEMTMNELEALKVEHYENWDMTGYEGFRNNFIEVEAEIIRRNNPQQVIEVTFELGYKWSVGFEGKESVETGLTKAEAMKVAKRLKTFSDNKAIIKAQTLTKEQKAENISWLRENSYNYGI